MSHNFTKKNNENMLDNSADDFASPVVFKKFKSSRKNDAASNACKVKKYSKKKQVTLHHIVKQNLKYSDINPEHLQMALALSKSISDDQTDEKNVEAAWNCDDKNEKKTTLLEFGFKFNKIKMNSEDKLCKKDTLRINKTSKFRFVSPILYIRTEEDRESLVQSKISLILSQNVQENSWGYKELGSSDILSEELLKINCSECSIFRLNYKLNELSRQSFSLPNLVTVENRTKCGFLLRDWKSIPLRDHTPDRPNMAETCNEEFIRVDKENQFNSYKNLKNFEGKTSDSTNNELMMHKPGDSSIIHENIDSDSNLCKNIKPDIEYETTMYMIPSPDLFEDQNSILFTNNTTITESNLTTKKKSGRKLFSEVSTLETHITPDHTSSCFPDLLKSLIFDKNVSKEQVVISSSSDEDDIKRNMHNNSIVENNLDNNDSWSDTDSKCFEVPPKELTKLMAIQKVPKVDRIYIPSYGNVAKEYTDNDIDLNCIATISKLADIVSKSSSNEDEELSVPNINMGSMRERSESYKEFTSLNVTEHIEDMLAKNYSDLTSATIPDKETTNYQQEQTESYCERISKSSSSDDLQNSSRENIQTYRRNRDRIYCGVNSSSPTFDISDEEHFSCNIKTNKNNGLLEDIEVLKGKQTNGHSYGTPLQRYASFSGSCSKKKIPSFGRYKSESAITPDNNFIVKTDNITPMMNYNQLDTPSIVNELSKYGLKPLKRKRGVNLLKHIYEATHPIVESQGDIVNMNNKVLKKRKKHKEENFSQDLKNDVSDNLLYKCHPIEPWTETVSESDLIFERLRSSKIPGCQIPLQIVWHNFLVQNPEIRESILLYEPLQVNIISKMLKEQGFKFHVQDLITFLDRKCITIKMQQKSNLKNS